MSVSRIGVLGAGTMGAGIAQVAVLGGLRTTLYDPDPRALEAGGVKIGEDIAKGESRGRWSEAESEAALERFDASTSEIGDLAGCELVIECSPDDTLLRS